MKLPKGLYKGSLKRRIFNNFLYVSLIFSVIIILNDVAMGFISTAIIFIVIFVMFSLCRDLLELYFGVGQKQQ